MTRKRNRLSVEDTTLWNKVTESIEPLHDPTSLEAALDQIVSDAPQSRPPKKQSALLSSASIKPAAKQARNLIQGPSVFPDQAERRSPNMDKKNFRKLVQGRKEIDATLDLHGMTSAQAQARFQVFINQGARAGWRLILVITGKGNKTHMDEFNRPRSGVLRSSLPDWVRSAALSDKVLQVTPAQQRHGGAGAFYVYLRRPR